MQLLALVAIVAALFLASADAAAAAAAQRNVLWHCAALRPDFSCEKCMVGHTKETDGTCSPTTSL
jgi:hypothetical protein